MSYFGRVVNGLSGTGGKVGRAPPPPFIQTTNQILQDKLDSPANYFISGNLGVCIGLGRAKTGVACPS